MSSAGRAGRHPVDNATAGPSTPNNSAVSGAPRVGGGAGVVSLDDAEDGASRGTSDGPPDDGAAPGGSHICGVCSRSFATRRNLTRHAANHSSTKPYVCTHLSCGKSFARSDLLLRHSRLHARPGGLSSNGNTSNSRVVSEGPADMDTSVEGEQQLGLGPGSPPPPPLPSLPSISTHVHHPLPAPPPVYPFNEQFNQFVTHSGVWGNGFGLGIGEGTGFGVGGAANQGGYMGMDIGMSSGASGGHYGLGSMPFALPSSGSGGVGAGGPGWDAWDSSLAWLVEGAISRGGSPVQAQLSTVATDQKSDSLSAPSLADSLPGSIDSTKSLAHRVPPGPLHSFFDSPRAPAPHLIHTPGHPPPRPPSHTTAVQESPLHHSPSLSTSAHNASQIHNLNTLASVAAAAVGASPSSTSTPVSVAGGEGIKEEERPASALTDERDSRWPQHFDPSACCAATRSPAQPMPSSFSRAEDVGRGTSTPEEETPHLPELTEPMPGSEKWRHHWLDDVTLSRVGNVCDLARFMPGSVERVFEMPSLHTVNHLLSNYFTHVLPLLPIVHLPTFNPSHAAPLVLAAMMCIGSAFSPLPGAARFSLDIAEQIRRAMAALYEHDLTNLRSEHIMHASLLTCIAGLWSGNKRAFELAEIARGQLVNLCRRGRLFDRPASRGDGLGWTAWAAGESRKRLGACIMLLDGFFPSLLQTPSYISQGELSNMVFPCDDRYWEASSPQQWQAMLGMAPLPPSPFFASSISALLTPRYVLNAQPPDPHLNPFATLILMTALQHHIYELRQHLYTYMSAGISVPMYQGAPDFTEAAPKPVNMALGFEGRKQWLTDALALWKKYYYTREVQDPFMLWGQSLLYMGIISLHVDVQDLNDAAGQHGVKAASLALGRLRKWAATPDAVESSAAAVQLLSILAFCSAQVGPYAPLCCFAATLTIWARLSLGDRRSWEPSLASELIGMIGGESLEGEDIPMAVRRYGASVLGKMTAWRVAQSLESILLRQ